MEFCLKKEELETSENFEIYDITEKVVQFILESGLKNGHAIIQPMHTTVGIFLNENEERLLKDFEIKLEEKAPFYDNYLHDDIDKRVCPADEPINGHSHLKAALYSNPSLALIFCDGKIQLGKYQRILFAEFDGPCPRKHKTKRQYVISLFGK